MTRQEQAGVSAPPYGKPTLTFGDGEYSCASCGLGMREPCQHWRGFLEAALATAPPEQGPQTVKTVGSATAMSSGMAKDLCDERLTAPPEQTSVCPRCEGTGVYVLGESCAICHGTGKILPEPSAIQERIVSQEQLDKSIAEIADPPQAASDGALSALAEALCDCDGRRLNGRARELANEIREALASHDQKVRSEVLAEIAPLIMEHRYIRDGGSSQCRCAKIVFHGQSWDDDFKSWWEHIRSLAGAVGHQHTSACYSKVPETEGKGEYLSCGKVAGDKGK